MHSEGFLPKYLKNRKQEKKGKAKRICNYFGHNMDCPYEYRDGKCFMIHCKVIREAHDIAEKREKTSISITKEEIEDLLVVDIKDTGLDMR